MDAQIERMLAWLRDHGGKFGNIEVKSVGAGERGVFARTDLQARELITDIPGSLIMTREKALESEIGRRIMDAGPDLQSGDAVFASFFLDEYHRETSWWAPYFPTVPPAFPHIPIFYGPDDLQWLKGSCLLSGVEEMRDLYRSDYDVLKETLPGFDRFSWEEFVWARVALGTRSFACEVNGAREDAMVPLMDMFNHRRPHNIHWACAPDRVHLRAGAPEPVAAGSELFISYGDKSNRRYLLVYGFVQEDHDGSLDEAAIGLGVPNDVAEASTKRRILLGLDDASRWRRLFLYRPQEDNDLLMETFSFLRLAQASTEELSALVAAHVSPRKVGPISAGNEVRALQMLEAACQKSLAGFETTVDEDEELLRSGSLSYNTRNCVVVRQGEKRVLQEFIAYARSTAAVLREAPERFEELKPQLIG